MHLIARRDAPTSAGAGRPDRREVALGPPDGAAQRISIGRQLGRQCRVGPAATAAGLGESPALGTRATPAEASRKMALGSGRRLCWDAASDVWDDGWWNGPQTGFWAEPRDERREAAAESLRPHRRPAERRGVVHRRLERPADLQPDVAGERRPHLHHR